MTLKVLICDDHELYRDGLRLLLQEAIPEVEVIEADSYPATQKQLAEHSDIALVLFDIQMPGTSALNGLKEIKMQYPVLPLVVVSTVDQDATIRQMLMLGADSFIAKTSAKETMITALKNIMQGEQVIISEHSSNESVVLSSRQLDTLELMAQGLSNKEIAQRLGISAATVREYVSDILALLQCDNRTQAVLRGKQLGYVLD